MRRFKDFSLVELMVVIAIIAILISMLMPSLGRAREKARIAICSSNSQQHGVAVASYAADHSGRYPEFTDGGRNASLWMGKTAEGNNKFPATEKPLNIYLGLTNDQDDAPFAQCISESSELNSYDDQGSSYHRNQKNLVVYYHSDETKADLGPIKMAMLVKPSLFLLSGERGGMVPFRNSNLMGQDKYYSHTKTGNTKFVYLYGDGHVRFTKITLDVLNSSAYMWDNQ